MKNRKPKIRKRLIVSTLFGNTFSRLTVKTTKPINLNFFTYLEKLVSKDNDVDKKTIILSVYRYK